MNTLMNDKIESQNETFHVMILFVKNVYEDNIFQSKFIQVFENGHTNSWSAALFRML